VRVVSYHPEAHPAISLSLFVQAGSRFENYLTKGSTHFLKHLAYKGNKNKYALNLIRDVEEVGGSFYTTTTRDIIGYHTHGNGEISESLNVLSNTLSSVTSPRLWEWEFEEVREIVGREVKEELKNDEIIAFEQLHRVAFRDGGLGNSLYVNHHDLKRLHPQHVQKHVSDYFFPGNRMVIFAVGVSHDKLESELKNFVDIKNESGTFELKAFDPLPDVTTSQENKYFGGESLVEGGKNTYVALGYQGTSINSGDYYIFTVLQEILGHFGGSKLGESPTGRIRNLGKLPFLIQASTFNLNYVDNGIFGISAKAKGGNAKELVSALVNEIKSLQNISDQELSRAKAVAKGKLLRKRECNINFGRTVAQRLFGSTPVPLINELQNIDSVTLEKVKSVIQKLSNSTPSLVSVGDVRGTPKL